MATQNDGGWKSCLACGAISAYVCVDYQSDGTIAGAALGSKGIGVTQEDATDASYVNVKLWTAPGTHMIQATGTAITKATTYSVGTGGYVIAVTTGAAALFTALDSAVASSGIVAEFQLI